MWYFTWILGVLLACSFGILAAVWYEFNQDELIEETEASAMQKSILLQTRR